MEARAGIAHFFNGSGGGVLIKAERKFAGGIDGFALAGQGFMRFDFKQRDTAGDFQELALQQHVGRNAAHAHMAAESDPRVLAAGFLKNFEAVGPPQAV